MGVVVTDTSPDAVNDICVAINNNLGGIIADGVDVAVFIHALAAELEAANQRNEDYRHESYTMAGLLERAEAERDAAVARAETERDALVAAAYEAAGVYLQSLANKLWPDGNRTELCDTIRALTPPHATAALDRIKAEARDAALVEAARLADGYGPVACDTEMRDAILALRDKPAPPRRNQGAKDMNRDKMIEALAKAIYCHDGRRPAPWDDDIAASAEWEPYRAEAMSQAAAVLELVGPKPLLWKPSTCAHLVWICQGTTTNQYRIALDDIANEYSVLIDGCLNWHPTLEAAQAAAQAHADAAHWGNTPIGKLLTEDNANG